MFIAATQKDFYIWFFKIEGMINYIKDENSIVTLTLDNPNRSANLINKAFGEALKKTLVQLKAETDLSGVIITSAKETFMAGADIDEMFDNTDAQNLFGQCEELKAGFRWLETQGKPVVAAINGTALGGGFELALAAHRRIVIDNPKIQIGLPEVTLGLLPGGGGVVRVTRILGLQPALPLLTEGQKLNPKEALSLGLIHELAKDKDDLLQKAKTWILANKTAKQVWDEDGYKMPGGTAISLKVASMLPIVPAMLTKKTNNNYPAPAAIIATAIEGSVVEFETATRIESRYFVQLATGNVSKNMINAFWKQLNEINGGKSRPVGDGIEKRYSFKKVGILGAGMMGSGIAYATALSGIEVVLKDVSQEAADKGKAYSETLLKKRTSKGKLTQEKADEILSRIKATANVNDLQGCDLVIEAVFENRELKAKVTKESEVVMDAAGVFASNTSTLPITGLATQSSRPKQFIGLHFFSPADRMPLVEIIVGKETSEETLARAFDFVKQIKKTPIVVNDSRGFYTSRVFATYVLEGIAMLGEGLNPHAIEVAGIKAGMPVGPLALTDEVSLSLLAHIRKQTEEDLKDEGKVPPTHAAYAVVDKLIALGREGKAKGAGFYDYPQGGKKQLWSGLKELFNSEFSKAPQDDTELQERLLFVQVLDTVRCLEEGVLRSVADANIGSIFGWGFAPFKGGTLQYINDYGLSKFIVRAKELEAKYGARFAVPKLLEEKERDNLEF